MFDSPRLGLPFLDGAQAQKHVTVNEALARLDAFASGRVESLGATTPPVSPEDGDAHIPGTGATGDWAGHDNALALFLNGGWEFVTPWSGAAFWIDDEGAVATFVGTAWVMGQIGGSAAGATTLAQVETFEQALTGAVTTTPAAIPDKAVVLGVTGRVTEAISGATGWKLGVAGSPDRYGSGYGTGLNSFAHGVTGQPQAYFGATPLEITAEGGSFTGGTVRLAVHYLALTPPAAV